jgi:mannose-6-phosphate isomerase-like protein (cupin superfamily)
MRRYNLEEPATVADFATVQREGARKVERQIGTENTMEKIHLSNTANALRDLYVYKKIGTLNGHVLSVVNVENRTLDFHVHENSDELFYVIAGAFRLETEDGNFDVAEGELIIVPKGVRHRPVVTKLGRFLMVELEGTLNKENSGDLYEA